MVVAAVVDLNRVIILCTRFTDEIFSFLVSIWCLIFIDIVMLQDLTSQLPHNIRLH